MSEPTAHPAAPAAPAVPAEVDPDLADEGVGLVTPVHDGVPDGLHDAEAGAADPEQNPRDDDDDPDADTDGVA